MSIKDYLHPLWKKTLEVTSNPNKSTVLNNAILTAVDTELTAVEEKTIKSKLDSYLDTATGEWLDFWGSWFGVKRKLNWDDATYRKRIKHHVTHARDTVQAIRDALADFLNTNKGNIKIYEPYNDIFITNYSNLNGKDHLMGGYYYYCIIDIRISVPYDTGIVDIINWFRPAGVIWLVTFDSGLGVDAPILDMSPTNMEFLGHQADITYWQGFDTTVNNTLTPNLSLGDTALKLFYLNKSEMNGVDVLAGDAHGGRTSYNYVGYSHSLHDMSDIKSVADVMKETIAVDEGRYQLLQSPDNTTIDINVSNKLYENEITADTSKHYTYFALDFRTYFFLNYEGKNAVDKAIGESNNDDKYNQYMGNYFDLTDLTYRLKAYVSPVNKAKSTVKIYNYALGIWVTYENLDVGNTMTGNLIQFKGGIEAGLSKTGLLVGVIESDTKDTDYTVGYNYIGLNTIKYYENRNSINIYGNPDETDQWSNLSYESGDIIDLSDENKSELVSYKPTGYPVRYIRNYIKNTSQPDIGKVTWSTVGIGTTDSVVSNFLDNTLDNGDFNNGIKTWKWDSATTSALYNVTDSALDVTYKVGGAVSVTDKSLFPNSLYRVKAIITSRSIADQPLSATMVVANNVVTKYIKLQDVILKSGEPKEYDFGTFSTGGITPTVSRLRIESSVAQDIQIKLVQISLDFKLDVDGNEYNYAPVLRYTKSPIRFNTPLTFDETVKNKITFNDTLGSPKYTDIIIETAEGMLKMGSRMTFTELAKNNMTYGESLGHVEMTEHCLTVDLGKVYTDFTNITLHHGSDLTAESISYESCLQTSVDGVNWHTWYDNYRGDERMLDEPYNEPSGRPTRFSITGYDEYNDQELQTITPNNNYASHYYEKEPTGESGNIAPNLLLVTQEPKHSTTGTFHTLYQLPKNIQEEKLHVQFNIHAISGVGVNTFKLVIFDAKQVRYKDELTANKKYSDRMEPTDNYKAMLGLDEIPIDASLVNSTPLSEDYAFNQGNTEYNFVINLPQEITYESPIVSLVSSGDNMDFWVTNMKMSIGSNRTKYER